MYAALTVKNRPAFAEAGDTLVHRETVIVENAVQIADLRAMMIEMAIAVHLEFVRSFLGGLFAKATLCTPTVKTTIDQNCCFHRISRK